MVQFSLADDKGLDSSLVMVVPDDRSHIFSATIQYRFMDNVGNTIFSGKNDFSLDLLPEKFLVHDNYPNPFNPITTIRYDLNVKENVKIKLIDIMGRTIKTDHYNGMLPGRHTYIWKGTNDLGKAVSTGIYFIQIDAGHESAMKKMLLLK